MTSMSTQSPAGEGRGEPLSVPQGLRAAHVPTKTSLLWGPGWHLNNSCCASCHSARQQGSYLGR